jgi:hypothetical protein
MNKQDEIERTVAFRASTRFPSEARLAAGRERLLAATMTEQGPPQGARPARRAHAPTGTRRHAVLAAGAAASVVVLGAAGYGAAAALSGYAPGMAGAGAKTAGTGTKAAVLTTVSGCAGLYQTSGTLEQVNGDSLVIETADGEPVTVTTTASTKINIADAPLSDITDGAPVTVSGPSSDGIVAAFKVTVGHLPSLLKQARPATTTQAGIAAQGTVADATSAGFTVVTSSGARIPVTTSSGTHVLVVSGVVGELLGGAATIAYGYAGPDGTLSAVGVLQQPPGTSMQLAMTKPDLRGCSPASIDNAMTTALVSG